MIEEGGIPLMVTAFGHRLGVCYHAGRAPQSLVGIGGSGPGPISLYISLAVDTSYDLTFRNDTGSALAPTAVDVIAEFDPLVMALRPLAGQPFLNPEITEALRTARADVPHFMADGVFRANGTLIPAPGIGNQIKVYDVAGATGLCCAASPSCELSLAPPCPGSRKRSAAEPCGEQADHLAPNRRSLRGRASGVIARERRPCAHPCLVGKGARRWVVAGWYAVAWAKWLTQIEVIDRPFDGYFPADRYHYDGEPVRLQEVRSVVIEPRPGQAVELGETLIRGVAWSGAAPIARVDVSIERGPCGEPWSVNVACTAGGNCRPASTTPDMSRCG